MSKLQVYSLYKGDYFSDKGIIEFQSVSDLESRIGGTVEAVPINDELILIRGIEFNILKVPVNRLWFKDNKPYGVVYGDAFVVRSGTDNQYTSVLKSDIDFIEDTFRPILQYKPNINQYTYIRRDLAIDEWKNE